MRRDRAWIVGLFLMASGCAAPAGPTEATPTSRDPPPSAEPAEPGPETGSIAGLVTDEENQPVPEARVGLVETPHETFTDAGGAFTLNDVMPGTYSLVAERLGYVSTGRKVEVVAGAVTPATFVLQALAVEDGERITTIHRAAYITAEQGFVAQLMEYQPYANLSSVRYMMCPNCYYVLFIERSPKAVLTEVQWAPHAVLNQDMETRYMWNRTGGGPIDLGTFQWGRLRNGAQMHWADVNIKSLHDRKVTRIELTITSSQIGGSLDHRINTWTSFAYNGPLPEGFTRLPPP